jgi:hypothetical protein
MKAWCGIFVENSSMRIMLHIHPCSVHCVLGPWWSGRIVFPWDSSSGEVHCLLLRKTIAVPALLSMDSIDSMTFWLQIREYGRCQLNDNWKHRLRIGMPFSWRIVRLLRTIWGDPVVSLRHQFIWPGMRAVIYPLHGNFLQIRHLHRRMTKDLANIPLATCVQPIRSSCPTWFIALRYNLFVC